MENEKPYVVVTAANEEYSDFLLAQLHSISKNTKLSVKYCILTDGISDTTKSLAERLVAPNITIEYFDVTKQTKPFTYSQIPSPHYWRLFAPFLFSEHSKILYLDVDTIIRGNFLTMFSTDLEQHTVGACQDYLQYVKVGINNWKNLGLNPERVYFNSGVLLINTERFIRNRIAEKAMFYSLSYSDNTKACGKWEQHDQYGLNIALDNDFIKLPAKFNFGSELESIDAIIVHFIGNGKPWSETCNPIFRDEFYYYLNQANGE